MAVKIYSPLTIKNQYKLFESNPEIGYVLLYPTSGGLKIKDASGIEKNVGQSLSSGNNINISDTSISLTDDVSVLGSFSSKKYFFNNNQYSIESSVGDLIFKDVNTGAKTLSELLSGTTTNSQTTFAPLPTIDLINYHTEVYTDPSATLSGEVVSPVGTLGTQVEYYAGKHNRVYFLYTTADIGPTGDYLRRISYYDYNTLSFAPYSSEINLELGTTDTHARAVMSISKSGYIYVAATGNDTEYRVYRSDEPEDITSFTRVTDATSMGYSTFNNYPDIRMCKNFMIGGHRRQLLNRQVVYTHDDGSTWHAHSLLELGADHWPYGAFIQANPEYGAFQSIKINNNEDTGDGKANNLPKSGLLWTDNGYVWGNMEYYASGKESGFSKDISTNGAITETEFLDNCLVYDASWGNDTDGYPERLLVSGTTTKNGNVVVIGRHGYHDDSSSINYINYVTITHWDQDNNQWVDNIIDASILYAYSWGFVIPSGLNDEEVDLFYKIDKGGGIHQLDWYRTYIGEKSLRKVDTLTNYSAGLYNMNFSPTFTYNRGLVISNCDADGSVNLVFFDHKWKDAGISGSGSNEDYVTEDWVTDTAVMRPQSFTVNNIPRFDASGNLVDSSIVADSSTFNLIDFIALSEISSQEMTSIPAQYRITSMIFNELSGNDVSISVGTTAGDNDIINELYLEPSTFTDGKPLLKSVFSKTTSQDIYIDSSNWNSASLDVDIRIEKFID